MDAKSLRERMCILQCLHGLFIFTLLCTGIVGLGLFGYIIDQPIRSCPVIYAMYTTFWLAISLSTLQVILGLVFLIWFVITLYQSGKSTNQLRLSSPNHISMTPRTVLEALGQPRVDAAHTNRVHQTYATSPRAHTVSLSSVRSGSHRCCHPKIGWLCLAGIFLALLSAGLVLNLVIVLNYVKYLNTSFIKEFMDVFIEAQIHFHAEASKKPNNALQCWNVVQSHYACCGLTNYTDWFSFQTNNTDHVVIHSLVPDSCYCESQCDADKVRPVNGSNTLVYAAGCSSLIHEVFTFKLHSSRLYFALTLGLLLVSFLVDLIYTLYTAYKTLALANDVSRAHCVRSAPNACGSTLNMQPQTSLSAPQPMTNLSDLPIVSRTTGS